MYVDFSLNKQIFVRILNKQKVISWKALRYMISEIQYGGRITDDRDRRLMITYTKVHSIFLNQLSLS